MHPLIISTGQQADLVPDALASFGLEAHVNLCVMQPGQPLAEMTARCLALVASELRASGVKLVVVQGDTASALAGAMAGFYERIPVAHVEAGLRTRDLAAPFPEEANRQVISRLTTFHFAPTLDAKANLLSEGIDPGSIEVTGNTVVDALNLLQPQIERVALPADIAPSRRLVVVTAHRRENLGRPLENICSAICRLARRRPELQFVFITHPNPAAGRTAMSQLSANRHARLSNVTLLPPLSYLKMLRLLSRCWLLLTDSGGLQEEAPSFRCPVLVLRDRTERTESLACGASRVIGTEPDRVVDEVISLIESPDAYDRMVPASNPYGDGQAASRVVMSLCRLLGRAKLTTQHGTQAA